MLHVYYKLFHFIFLPLYKLSQLHIYVCMFSMFISSVLFSIYFKVLEFNKGLIKRWKMAIKWIMVVVFLFLWGGGGVLPS